MAKDHLAMSALEVMSLKRPSQTMVPVIESAFDILLDCIEILTSRGSANERAQDRNLSKHLETNVYRDQLREESEYRL